jgi:hypothetical protein
MINDNDCNIQITNRANRTFIKEEGHEAACYFTVIRDLQSPKNPGARSLKMSFELTDREAMQISRNLKHINYHMQSDVAGRFDIDLEGESAIIAGLHALFKASVHGKPLSGSAGSRPLVSPKMQMAIIDKLGGLVTNSERVRENLDEGQKSMPSSPVYD